MSPVQHGSQGGGDGSQGGGDASLPFPEPEMQPTSPRNVIEVMEEYFTYVSPQAQGFQLGGYTSGSLGLPPWFEDDPTTKLIRICQNAICLGIIPDPPAGIGAQDADQLHYETELHVTEAAYIYDAGILKNVMKLFVEVFSKVFEHLETLAQTVWKTDKPDPNYFNCNDVCKKGFLILSDMCDDFLFKYPEAKKPEEIKSLVQVYLEKKNMGDLETKCKSCKEIWLLVRHETLAKILMNHAVHCEYGARMHQDQLLLNVAQQLLDMSDTLVGYLASVVHLIRDSMTIQANV